MQFVTLRVLNPHVGRNLSQPTLDTQLSAQCLLLACHCRLLPSCIFHGVTRIGKTEHHLSSLRSSPLEEGDIRIVLQSLPYLIHHHHLACLRTSRNSHVLRLYPVRFHVLTDIQHSPYHMATLCQNVRQ